MKASSEEVWFADLLLVRHDMFCVRTNGEARRRLCVRCAVFCQRHCEAVLCNAKSFQIKRSFWRLSFVNNDKSCILIGKLNGQQSFGNVIMKPDAKGGDNILIYF